MFPTSTLILTTVLSLPLVAVAQQPGSKDAGSEAAIMSQDRPAVGPGADKSMTTDQPETGHSSTGRTPDNDPSADGAASSTRSDDTENDRSTAGAPAASTTAMSSEQFAKHALASGQKEVREAEMAVTRATRPEVKSIASMLVRDHSDANRRLSAIVARKGWSLQPDTSSYASPPTTPGSTARMRTDLSPGQHPSDAASHRGMPPASTSVTAGATMPSSGTAGTPSTAPHSEAASSTDASSSSGTTTAGASASTATSDGFDSQFIARQISGHESSVASYRHQAQSGDDTEVKAFAREILPKIEMHLTALRRMQRE